MLVRPTNGGNYGLKTANMGQIRSQDTKIQQAQSTLVKSAYLTMRLAEDLTRAHNEGHLPPCRNKVIKSVLFVHMPFHVRYWNPSLPEGSYKFISIRLSQQTRHFPGMIRNSGMMNSTQSYSGTELIIK